MRGSRNFSRSPRPIFGNFTICVYKKFKEPPPHSRSAHANMNGNAIPAWIGEMLKYNMGKIHYYRPLSLSLLDLFLFMFIQKLNIYIYICVISACHMLEENYIKIIISELLFNILRQHSGEQCIKIITSSHRRAFYVEFYYHLLHCFNIKCSFLFLFLSHIFVSLNFVK